MFEENCKRERRELEDHRRELEDAKERQRETEHQKRGELGEKHRKMDLIDRRLGIDRAQHEKEFDAARQEMASINAKVAEKSDQIANKEKRINHFKKVNKIFSDFFFYYHIFFRAGKKLRKETRTT